MLRLRQLLLTILIIFNISTNSVASITSQNVYNDDTTKISSFSFLIQDSPSLLFTMRQFDLNYLSSYRFLNKELSKSTSRIVSSSIQLGIGFFLLPLTHEEGHRSILTSKGIGSVSQPYFNLKGAAYVRGVKDNDLIDLRDNDLPQYIRLHTAGLESDYMICNHIEEEVLLGFDTRKNLGMEYLLRKSVLVSYYTLSIFPFLNPNLTEESNELDRDIVGHDVYGAVKNLYRPELEFYRYTNYDDLTDEEVKFVKRAGVRALINTINPLLFKQLMFFNKDDFKLSVSAGYTMAPFGDFIDENIWMKFNKKYNVHSYFRQYQNRENWFLAGGIRLIDYPLTGKLKASISGHVWNQPKDLDFFSTTGKPGGSCDLMFKYIIINNSNVNSVSIDLGASYKTYGFLPEEVLLTEKLGLRFGITVNLNQKGQ